MLQSLRKSIQEVFVVTNGYSVSHFIDKEAGYVSSWSMDLIRSLDQEHFKQLCAGYFEEKCYRANLSTQHDQNVIDIWLFKESYSSANPFGIIQCWGTKAIPVESNDLKSLSKIIKINKIPLTAFITAGKFSKQAADNNSKRLKLIDGEKLLTLIQALPEIRKQRLLKKII